MKEPIAIPTKEQFARCMTQVVSLKNFDVAELPEDCIRVDRMTRFGNPFREGRDGTRREVLRKYWEYITDRIKWDKSLLGAIRKLKGKRLACWCAPKDCHAAILVWLSHKI